MHLSSINNNEVENFFWNLHVIFQKKLSTSFARLHAYSNRS